MLPDKVKRIFNKNKNLVYQEYIGENNTLLYPTEEDKKWMQKNLGIINIDSAFVDYYSIFALPPLGNGDELLSLQEIVDEYNEPYFWWDDIDEDIKQKFPDAPKRYIQFSSIEGGGSYFYDNKTDKVYNVNWGEEEAMITGKLKPMFNSFYDFLEWYYDEDEE
jgi:hypothetical protein